eukprot:scaffold4355_cov349-Prasinococcus_capsulatus_cf.AAC.2
MTPSPPRRRGPEGRAAPPAQRYTPFGNDPRVVTHTVWEGDTGSATSTKDRRRAHRSKNLHKAQAGFGNGSVAVTDPDKVPEGPRTERQARRGHVVVIMTRLLRRHCGRQARTRFLRAPAETRQPAARETAATAWSLATTRTAKCAWYSIGSPPYARKSAPNLAPDVMVYPRRCRSANTAQRCRSSAVRGKLNSPSKLRHAKRG